MGLFSFGKRIKNRTFDYTPRYYDPDKEEFEKRMALYKRDGSDTDLAKERIRGNFRRTYRVNGDYAKKSNRQSNRILLMTIAILLLITFFFISEYLPRIIASFE